MDWLISSELLPLSWYKKMREEHPMAFNAEYNSWDVFKYEDVKRIMSDHEHFSSQFTSNPTSEEPIEASILRIDPPKHKQMRSIVMQAFTPRTIEALGPKIRAIAESLLEGSEEEGRLDFVHQFSIPLPIIVIAEMLGVPAEHRDRFKAWSDALVGDDYEKFKWCQREMTDYFGAIAEERRREPKDDLISALVQAQAEGEKLNDVELIGFCILLLVAGNETTTNLLSSSLLCLEQSPELYARLADDPAQLPHMIEEVLRYCSPVQSMPRKVKKDVVYSGHQMTAGQWVNVWLGSANHDGDQFDNPELFDMTRSPNPHVAFGHGIHFCLGAPLARLEAKIALGVLLEKFRRIRRDRNIPLERLSSSFIFGVKQLPMTIYRR